MSCVTCLSVDRTLYHLGKYSKMFMKLSGEFYAEQAVHLLQICWECLAVLQKMLRFQEQARRASILIAQGTMKTLSNLRLYHCKEFYLSLNSDESNIIVEPKQELDDDTKTVKQSDDEKFDEDHSVMNNEDTASIDHNTEVEEDNVKNISTKVTRSKWAQKRLKQNKLKVKVLKADEFKSEDLFRRVQINPYELAECIQREKESAYYNCKHYKCDKCVIGFGCEESLVAHKTTKHRKDLGRYMCDICKTRVSKKHHLIEHCKSHYYKHECTLCQYCCWSRNGLLWHIRTTHIRIYQCVQCGLRFLSRKEFYEHYKKYHESFICDYCGRGFKMRYCIKTHIRKLHSPIVCVPCNKSFARSSALWLHNKLKHSARLDKGYCVECDKEFSSIYAYKWHLNTSLRHRPRQKKSFPCSECDKIFTKKIYMMDHYNFVHLKIYKYPCGICNKKFLRNADLVKHKRKVHEGIALPKNKLCYICGRGFTHNKILANHVRIHTGERPFSCKQCPKTFAQKSALTTHSRNVHKEKYS